MNDIFSDSTGISASLCKVSLTNWYAYLLIVSQVAKKPRGRQSKYMFPSRTRVLETREAFEFPGQGVQSRCSREPFRFWYCIRLNCRFQAVLFGVNIPSPIIAFISKMRGPRWHSGIVRRWCWDISVGKANGRNLISLLTLELCSLKAMACSVHYLSCIGELQLRLIMGERRNIELLELVWEKVINALDRSYTASK